jgi:hypothetical protein
MFVEGFDAKSTLSRFAIRIRRVHPHAILRPFAYLGIKTYCRALLASLDAKTLSSSLDGAVALWARGTRSQADLKDSKST